MPKAQPVNPLIPLWLKVAWTVWLVVWAPVYWHQYGAQNFLYFCDVGNFLIAIGLWSENRLILSWQAVGLLVFQTLYAVDLVGAVISGHHIIGGTEYMFDPKINLFVRLLGLYHLVVPPLLLWALHRLGYDPEAFRWQTFTMWTLVLFSFFWRPQSNVNWARGLGHEQHMVPHWLYLIIYLIVVPVVVYWPTHWALKRWAGARAPSNR
ncbi:MAG TPA: hypothetical protein VHV29_15205 [Terriglobales bacterium]|nr:hypothetical protein [Terriglobales bacterium]